MPWGFLKIERRGLDHGCAVVDHDQRRRPLGRLRAQPTSSGHVEMRGACRSAKSALRQTQGTVNRLRGATLRRRVVDATGELCETDALAAPALADDLGRDRDGGLLRCTRPKIEADWARQPSDLHLSDPYVA
jgi:hypothetical protein